MNDSLIPDDLVPDDSVTAEVIRLASASLTQDIDDADFERLNEILEQDETARETYLLFMNDSQTMRTWAAGQLAIVDVETPSLAENLPTTVGLSFLLQRFTKRAVYTSVVVASLSIIALITVMHFSNPRSPEEQTEPTGQQQFVAWLADAHNVSWRDETKPTRMQLSPGKRLAFASGSITITYRTGASVIIEGPAEFVVGSRASDVTTNEGEQHLGDGSNSGYLKFGKLVAQADTKQARGFTINTPQARVVDLGTEFTVAVDQAGDVRLHVHRGEVRVAGTTSATTHLNQVLKAGQGIGWNKSGDVKPLSQPLGKRYADVASTLKQAPEQIVSNLGPGLLLRRFHLGAPRLCDQATEVVDAPAAFVGLDAVIPPRGVGFSQPGAGFRFRVNQPSKLYLLVHNRGDHALDGWQRTEQSLAWTIEGQTHIDTVYTRLAQPGEVNIPPHSWRDQQSYYGVPHVCLIAPQAETKEK